MGLFQATGTSRRTIPDPTTAIKLPKTVINGEEKDGVIFMGFYAKYPMSSKGVCRYLVGIRKLACH